MSIVRICVAAREFGKARRVIAWRALLPLLLFGLTGFAAAQGSARLPAGFDVGARISVKGEFEPDGVLRARELALETNTDTDEELRGLIETIDRGGWTLTLLGFTVTVPLDAKLQREPDGEVLWDELAVGQRVKISGRRDATGQFVARKLRVRTETYPERRYVGPIEAINDAPEGDVTLQLLGRRVRVTDRTDLVLANGKVQRLPPRARAASADDDLLLLGNIKPWQNVALSGELRLRGEVLENRDLDDATRDGDVAPEFLGIAGGLARFGPLDIYAEASARRQFFLDGGPALGAENEKNLLNLSQLYLRYGRRRGDFWWRVQLGRQRVTDQRQWVIYTKNLDALRVAAGWKRWTIDATYGRALFNKNHFKAEQTRDNLYVAIGYLLTADTELSAYLLDRRDRTAAHDSPRLIGLRALGAAGRQIDFWIDLAEERGERLVTDSATARTRVAPIRANAFDVGLTWRPRTVLDPSLTVGWARGSGGGDEVANPADERRVAGTFRQSGLERNRGSFNGVVSFSYYGELLDPELANLRVSTLGVGIRPQRSFSVDLIRHDYAQDVLSRRRLHASPIDAKPSGLSRDIGKEWDLIVGFEPSRLIELRFTAGRFQPGAAFPFSGESAGLLSFQAKLRF